MELGNRIRVTAEEVFNTIAPDEVKSGVAALELHISEKGFEDFHSELIKVPRKTDRGVLYAKGTFAGPSPDTGEERDPDDFTEYHWDIFEDKRFEDLYIVEVLFNSRLLASFEITSNGLKLLDGELPRV